VKYAKDSLVVSWSGGQTVLRRDQTVDPDHPLVAERPDLFADAPSRPQLRAIERATAAPGERRQVAPPKATPKKAR